MTKVRGDEQLTALLKGVAHLLITIPVVGRTMPTAVHESYVSVETAPLESLRRKRTELLGLYPPALIHADLLALGKYLPHLSASEIGLKALEIGVQALMREHVPSQPGPVEISAVHT